MDLFAQLQPAASGAPVVPPPSVPDTKIITVSIEKIKNRTVTAIYEFDYTLDKTIKSPEEMLSKLKKKICNSNGFIRKPESATPAKKKKSSAVTSDDDETGDESSTESSDEDDLTSAFTSDLSLTVPATPVYVIQGNHSNAICRYIYSLGVSNIIRTGTA